MDTESEATDGAEDGWTEAQRAAVEAYRRLGTVSEVARELCRDRKTIRGHLQRARVLKPRQEPIPEPHDGLELSGVSSYQVSTPEEFARTGIKHRWIKTNARDKDRLDAFREAVERISSGISPCEPTAPVAHTMDDLMVVLPQGDAHVGLLAWAAEAGENWDLQRAEHVLYNAARLAFDAVPPAGRCRIINMGDYFHTDDQSNRTARSGHQLDVDSRWAKMLEVGIRLQQRIVECALRKFGTVEVENVRGNHDEHSALMLSMVQRAYFRNEPRVTVCDSPAMHNYFEHGQCLIGTHHGHLTRGQSLPILMAASNAEAWGRTRHRRVYCGHVHRDVVIEHPGVTVEYVNTLTARDAYAAGSGYMSGRDQKIDVWHKEYGLINRQIIGISMVDSLAPQPGR